MSLRVASGYWMVRPNPTSSTAFIGIDNDFDAEDTRRNKVMCNCTQLYAGRARSLYKHNVYYNAVSN